MKNEKSSSYQVDKVFSFFKLSKCHPILPEGKVNENRKQPKLPSTSDIREKLYREFRHTTNFSARMFPYEYDEQFSQQQQQITKKIT